MNERVVVVLLLITIVLSITSLAIVFSIPTLLEGNRVVGVVVSDPDDVGAATLEILASPGGEG